MNIDKLTDPIVKKAIEALQSGDKSAWFSLFRQTELFDDGNRKDFREFFEEAIGHERFTQIEKVENDGLDLYGRFHSDRWGDFNTYFKFRINSESRIDRLDIGQAD